MSQPNRPRSAGDLIDVYLRKFEEMMGRYLNSSHLDTAANSTSGPNQTSTRRSQVPIQQSTRQPQAPTGYSTRQPQAPTGYSTRQPQAPTGYSARRPQEPTKQSQAPTTPPHHPCRLTDSSPRPISDEDREWCDRKLEQVFRIRVPPYRKTECRQPQLDFLRYELLDDEQLRQLEWYEQQNMLKRQQEANSSAEEALKALKHIARQRQHEQQHCEEDEQLIEEALQSLERIDRKRMHSAEKQKRKCAKYQHQQPVSVDQFVDPSSADARWIEEQKREYEKYQRRQPVSESIEEDWINLQLLEIGKYESDKDYVEERWASK
jgi:hypothetical protein